MTKAVSRDPRLAMEDLPSGAELASLPVDQELPRLSPGASNDRATASGLGTMVTRDDDELRARQEELLSTQEQLGRLLRGIRLRYDDAAIPVFLLDRQGMVVHANQMALAMVGDQTPKRGVASRAFLSVVARSDHPALLKVIEKGLGGEVVKPFALSVTTAGRAARPCDIHVISLIGLMRTPCVAVAVFERSLTTHDNHLAKLMSALIDGSRDVMAAYDKSGRLLVANRAMARLMQTRVDDLLDKTRDAFMPLGDALAQRESDREVLEGGQTIEFRERFSGSLLASERLFDTRKFLLVDEQGVSLGVGGISRDVTEEARHLQDLKMSELVFQQSSDAIILTDAQARILRTNPAFELHSGFSQASVLRRPAHMLLQWGGKDRIVVSIARDLAARGHWTGEVMCRRANGEVFPTVLRIRAIRDSAGLITRYLITETDMSALKDAEKLIDRMSRFDVLTGLPNRALLFERVHSMAQVAARRQRTFALLYVDLDNFKDVNDSLGHAVGDELLKALSLRLKAHLRSEDMVARIGGDEFVVLLADASEAAAVKVGNKLLEAIRQPVSLAGVAGYVPSLSVGVALYPKHGSDVDSLVQAADTAMYAAKGAGRGCVEVYSVKMRDRVDWQFRVRSEIADALTLNQMQIFVQPKFALEDHALVGAEALIRWFRVPGRPPVMPAEFLWAIEQPALLAHLDNWVMDNTIGLMGRWCRQGVLPPDFIMSINKTSSSSSLINWLSLVKKSLRKHRLPAGMIEFEFTEHVLASLDKDMLKMLRAARKMGLTFSIDDFGTGYSNLSYLQKMPISVIKIDASFIKNIDTNSRNRALVQSLLSLSKGLGLKTIAEGIESQLQLNVLKDMGCDYGQGYLFAKPLPATTFEKRYLAPTLQAPASPVMAHLKRS